MLFPCLILTLIALPISIFAGWKSPAKSSYFTAAFCVLITLSSLLCVIFKESIEDILAILYGQGTLITLLIQVWITGSTITFSIQCCHLFRLHRWKLRAKRVWSGAMHQELRRSAAIARMTQTPTLKLSEEAHSPVVTGLLRPTIIVPYYARSWDTDTLRTVFLHELAHLKRYDLWFAFVAQLNCALLWWNPFVWLLRKQLRKQSEYAVDAKVISSGISPTSYVKILRHVADEMLKQRPLLNNAATMAHRASITNRVENLLDS